MRKEVYDEFSLPEVPGTTSNKVVDATTKAGIGVIILIGLWEGTKWTVAVLAAAPSGGTSVSLAAALP